jgi:hypothetical protein
MANPEHYKGELWLQASPMPGCAVGREDGALRRRDGSRQDSGEHFSEYAR